MNNSVEEVKQPAQPESGEVVRPVRGRIFTGCDTYIGDATDLWYAAEAYRRLQSALAAERRRHAEGFAAWKANNAHHTAVIDHMRARLEEIVRIGSSPAARDNGPNYIANRMYHCADAGLQELDALLSAVERDFKEGA